MEFYGWDPREAANRATQAVYVLTALVTNAPELVKRLSQDTVNQLELIASRLDEKECVNCYERMRSMFTDVLGRVRVQLWSGTPERIWRLFLEHSYFPITQLRANLQDVKDCFDRVSLPRLFNCTWRDIVHLPPSSEIVVYRINNELRCELVTAIRQLTDDMRLMLDHAAAVHQLIVSSRAVNNDDFVTITHDQRLDTYCRLVLLLAATAVDAALNEYSIAAQRLLTDSPAPKEQVNRASVGGVTLKLHRLPELLAGTFGGQLMPKDLIADLTTLIEMRNRIAHADGRLKCWDAMAISPSAWSFSDRFDAYAPDQLANLAAHVGHEMRLATFALDTTINFIHHLHRSIYLDDVGAVWLNFK